MCGLKKEMPLIFFAVKCNIKARDNLKWNIKKTKHQYNDVNEKLASIEINTEY